MKTAALTQQAREAALDAMAATTADEPLDVLVIGGGVTGAGIVLDAVSRGLRVGIIEAQDWASGTSSRSTKLVHGGLRYLQMLDFHLVRESLRERDLLIKHTAPHLVRPVSFLYPLEHRIWERAYVGTGIAMYDTLASLAPGKRAMPWHDHIMKSEMMELFPDLDPTVAVGAVRYWDAMVDDARLVLTLVRTAVTYGAYAASRTQALSMVKNSAGHVKGALAVDLETGREFTVHAKQTISSTGVWTEETEALSGTDGGLRVLASKGIHIVVPREKVAGNTGLILQTEKSVLFFIPWPQYWIIGTTDTPWHEDFQHPVATSEDVEYVLEHANAVLDKPLTKDDIVATYAGLRPLLQPGTKDGTSSAKASREHTVASPVPGLTVIAGGKLTSYRVMAEDAVDFALGARARQLPSVTTKLPLVGAEGLAVVRRQGKEIGRRFGWSKDTVEHLLGRYGTLLTELVELVEAQPDLAAPLAGAPDYLRAEIAYAARYEDVLHLEDIVMHRVRLNYEQADRGRGALEEIVEIAGDILGWDADRKNAEIAAYTARIDAELAAQREADDAAAVRARLHAEDVAPLRKEVAAR